MVLLWMFRLLLQWKIRKKKEEEIIRCGHTKDTESPRREGEKEQDHKSISIDSTILRKEGISRYDYNLVLNCIVMLLFFCFRSSSFALCIEFLSSTSYSYSTSISTWWYNCSVIFLYKKYQETNEIRGKISKQIVY